MITVPVRHLLLHNPGVPPPSVTDAFWKLIHDCNLWTESQAGITLAHEGVEYREASINVAPDNPWPETAGWWMNRPDYDPTAYAMVFLAGWDSRLFIGWGGRLGYGGLAVVGEYALRRILSRPTTPDDPTDAADPQAIVDDWYAGHLYLHEMGHALGLTHDFETPGAVLGYEWWNGYNAVLGPRSRAELDRLFATREEDAYLLVQACKRPSVSPEVRPVAAVPVVQEQEHGEADDDDE